VPGTSASKQNRRIVIIEDDAVFVTIISELLETEGYTVFSGSSATDAHKLVREVKPRVVILDLRMPGDVDMDESGWHVLDHLLLDPETRDIPVLVSSGAVWSIEAHRPALVPQNGVRVLVKPYTIDQLLAELSEITSEPPPAERGWASGKGDPLTARQREIAQLIAMGCTNREIARRLVLEVGTVANHVAQIMDRLGVSNRAQIAAWAVGHGLSRPTTRSAAE
jgi:two-component system nitrate/nitrite response regulator NarL